MTDRPRVAPSGKGNGTRNTYVAQSLLWVITDLRREDVGDGGDVFTLEAASGGRPYKKSLDVKGYRWTVGRYVALKFEGLDRTAKYTLTVVMKGGLAFTLFEEVPFGELAALSDDPLRHRAKPATEDGSHYEIKPGGYLSEKVLRTLQGAPWVVVGRADRRRAQPVPEHPDTPEKSLTGRYESEDGGMTLQVNQAGKFLACWASIVLRPDQGREGQRVTIPEGPSFESRTWFIMRGDQQGDGTFVVWMEDRWQDGQGTITPQADGSFLLESRPAGAAPSTRHFLRNNSLPTLSEVALSHYPISLVWKSEWMPLTRGQHAKLQGLLAPERILPFIHRWRAAGGTGTLSFQRNEALKALDAYMGEVFASDTDKLPAGKKPAWHRSDVELARYHARFVLAQKVSVDGDPEKRSLRWWIAKMIRETDVFRPEHLQKHLGFRSRSSKDKGDHYYSFRLVATWFGADIGAIIQGGAGVLSGGLTVARFAEPREEDPDTPFSEKLPGFTKDKRKPLWKEDFIVTVAGLSLGLGVGVSVGKVVCNEGEATSFDDWKPHEIPGMVTFEASEVGGAVGVGVSYGAETMTLFGNGPHDCLAADMGGWSDEAGASLEISASGKASVGVVYPNGRTYKPGPVTEAVVANDYAIDDQVQNEVHFGNGSAMLTPEGMRVLRLVCAKELVGFKSQLSTLGITGYADTLDTAEYNKELSRFRAENTLQAIKDILGPDFRIPEGTGQLVVEGMGEEPARKAAGITDDRAQRPDPAWRKIEVVLNRRLVLTLHAAAPTDELPAEAPPPPPPGALRKVPAKERPPKGSLARRNLWRLSPPTTGTAGVP